MPSALALGRAPDTFNESPGVSTQQGSPAEAQVGLSCTQLSRAALCLANEEHALLQNPGTLVMCLQGAYCNNSRKVIQSKLIKTLHLLILQYKEAGRRGNKDMMVLIE